MKIDFFFPLMKTHISKLVEKKLKTKFFSSFFLLTFILLGKKEEKPEIFISLVMSVQQKWKINLKIGGVCLSIDTGNFFSPYTLM